jgi:probable O-glycosylation ligase (exosortase A-associated)
MFMRVMKILFMIFVALIVLHEKRHIVWLVWILALSIGFYGIKGGIFTLATGGNFIVWGPPESFIEGNNEIALALVVIIPLFYFLHDFYSNKWIKRALIAAMGLCAIASLGSHSRGALLAIGAMGVFLWWRSDKKLIVGPILILLAIASLAFMPADWWARMETISTYQQDASAMGRINAWHAMWNLAKEHVFGGGFDIYTPEIFQRYAPVPEDVHAAHSIYFQVLGEHGFIGLFLYLLIGMLTWRSASWIYRNTKADLEMKWAASLASMCQVSMLGFAVGGAFLSLAYFDLPYDVLVVVVILRRLVEVHQRAIAPAVRPIPSLSITPR